MSGGWTVDQGLSDFFDYTVTTSPGQIHTDLGYEPECVADYVQAWVQSKRGVYACIGDYRVFLTTLVAIISDWADDPSALHYVNDDDEMIHRRPEAVFVKRSYGLFDHPVLDPHFFATQTFRAMHGTRPPVA